MSGNKQGGVTLRQTMIARFGSEAAWKDWMRDNGSKGGSKSSKLKGFGTNRELARTAGATGGRISRRTKKG